VYGDPTMAKPFMDAFGFDYKEYNSGGMLSQWMAEEMEAAILIELPNNAKADGFVDDSAKKLITALDAWLLQVASQGT